MPFILELQNMLGAHNCVKDPNIQMCFNKLQLDQYLNENNNNINIDLLLIK